MATPESNQLPSSITPQEQASTIANFDVLLQGVSIKVREMIQGYGGLTSLNRFLMQIPYIEDMDKHSTTIQNNLIKFQRAIKMADPELNKGQALPLKARQSRVIGFLGPEKYYEIALKIFELNKEPIPEVIVIWEGFEWLGEAYKAGYQAITKLFYHMADYMGKESFKIQDTDFLRYLELSRLEYIKGETRISVPEKGLLEFCIYGNLASLPYLKAIPLIDAGIQLLKLGFITELIDGSFSPLFEDASSTFFTLYKDILLKVLPSATEALGFIQTPDLVYALPKQTVFTYPILMAEPSTWASGNLLGKMTLEAFNAPLYVAEESNVSGILSVPGRGKTALMNSISCASIMSKGYVNLIPMNDDTNQPALACMPVFNYDRRTQRLTDTIRTRLGLEPQPVPIIVLNVVTPPDYDELRHHPLTVFDRIIKIQDPKAFTLDFQSLINVELEESREILEGFGYGPFHRHSGIICFRNLDRLDLRSRTNVELQIAYNVMSRYDRWRETNRQQPIRMQIDEIADFAPARAQLAGSDQIVMGAVIERFIRRARRKGTPLDWSSQRTTETILPLKDMTTNLFFRDLPQSPRKEQSQIDYLLDLLQLENKAIKDAILELNRKNAFRGTFLWFWYHRPSREVNVVASLPPTFMLEDKTMNTRDLIQLYQRTTGHVILQNRPEDVKDISQVAGSAEEPEEERPRRRGRPRTFMDENTGL